MHMWNETCNTLWRVLIHIQMELLGFVLIFLLIKNPVFLIKKMELLNPWPHFRRNISLGHPFSKREYMKMWEIDHNIKSIWPQFLINIFVWLWLCYNLHVLVCKFSIGDVPSMYAVGFVFCLCITITSMRDHQQEYWMELSSTWTDVWGNVALPRPDLNLTYQSLSSA